MTTEGSVPVETGTPETSLQVTAAVHRRRGARGVPASRASDVFSRTGSGLVGESILRATAIGLLTLTKEVHPDRDGQPRALDDEAPLGRDHAAAPGPGLVVGRPGVATLDVPDFENQARRDAAMLLRRADLAGAAGHLARGIRAGAPHCPGAGSQSSATRLHRASPSAR